jgi:hypothetical protein
MIVQFKLVVPTFNIARKINAVNRGEELKRSTMIARIIIEEELHF